MPDPSQRRFSEAEMRAIFARAAERQQTARRVEEAGRAGLTLEELQQVAAGAGIDPAHVAAAAREVAAGEPPAARETLLGMPVLVRRSRPLPGPVTDAAWEPMVAALRREFGGPGVAGQAGRLREWTTAAGGRHSGAAVRVSLEPEGAGSRLTVEQQLRNTALPLTAVAGVYGAIALFFVLMAAGPMEEGALLLVALFAALAVLMFGATQAGLRLHARRQERRFEAVLDRLELIARDAAPAPEHAAAPVAAPSPRLALDDMAPEEEAPAARRSRTRS